MHLFHLLYFNGRQIYLKVAHTLIYTGRESEVKEEETLREEWSGGVKDEG